MSIFYKSIIKGVVAAFFTFIIYQFFYIEFFRSNVEDSAFDLSSWILFSKTKEDTNNSHLFLLLVDDKYLKSKNLLDENNETNYGYILPRNYLADIISDMDILVEDLDEENYPKALFIDYDFSYLSDTHNIKASADDLRFLELLKHKRPYSIYLPRTSNYNFIYFSEDKKIKELIKNGIIKFVSTGITTTQDGVSRRYYPYERYKDARGEDELFTYVGIELYNLRHKIDSNITESFSQQESSLIENRIIFRDKYKVEDTSSYTSWQSYWTKLFSFSANYPLDEIYEDDIKDAVFMVGPSHSASQDSFDIDEYSQNISGVEMHANAFMTLNYLDGKLRQLPLYRSILIVFIVVLISDILVKIFENFSFYKSILKWNKSIKSNFFKNIISIFVPDLFLILSMGILFGISLFLLSGEEHYWFNWLIPSMLAIPYMLIENKRSECV